MVEVGVETVGVDDIGGLREGISDDFGSFGDSRIANPAMIDVSVRDPGASLTLAREIAVAGSDHSAVVALLKVLYRP